MPGTLGVAVAQLRPRLRDTGTNLDVLRGIVAGNPGVDLIVFPELFLGGYTVRAVEELAVDGGGTELESIAGVARDHATALVFGAAERTDGGIANAALCVDANGDVAAVYRKYQLFGAEKEAFIAGDELVVVELGGVKTGVMICFDVEFPEIARALARAGAELLVTISANMEPFGNDHAVFASARALENGLPHVYVNQVGPGDEGLVFTGESAVVSADGEILARADASGEAVLLAEVPLAPSGTRESYLDELRSPMPDVRIAQREARTESG